MITHRDTSLTTPLDAAVVSATGVLRASVPSKTSLEGASELGAVASTDVEDLSAGLHHLSRRSGGGSRQKPKGKNKELRRLEEHGDKYLNE